MSTRKKVITTPYWWTRTSELSYDNGMNYLKGTKVAYTPGDVKPGEYAILHDSQVHGDVVRRVAAVKDERYLLICPDGTEPPRWCKMYNETTLSAMNRRFIMRGRFEALVLYNAERSNRCGVANYDYVKVG